MKKIITLLILAVALSVSACGTKPEPVQTDQLDQIRTAAARTVEAMTTAIVAADLAAQTATANSPIQIAEPTEPNLSEVTPAPMDPPTPTEGSQAPTPIITPTADQSSPCNLAAFVDETIPDGSQFTPGAAYTKTWTLRNEGSCTWTKDYSVVFVGGSSMAAPASMPLSDKSVAPGESVTIRMPLTAPNSAGAYKAEFKLRSAEGVIFAFRNIDHTFWVEIQVRGDSINLADSFCSAAWSSPAGRLPCPGRAGDAGGFVTLDPQPQLENGAADDEPALWLGLQNADDSYLQAVFPALYIPANAKFTTVLGCLRGNTACEAEFSLNYQDASGGLHELGSWTETHDGQISRVEVDLSAFGGKITTFVFLLKAKGSPVGDVIHLLKPMIQP